jgi:hypothetical protein
VHCIEAGIEEARKVNSVDRFNEDVVLLLNYTWKWSLGKFILQTLLFVKCGYFPVDPYNTLR